MTLSKRMKIVLISACVGFVGVEVLDLTVVPGFVGLVPTAEARVGRPLTPVSVAGVARRTTRRTVRRCTAGVYYC
jgi:hypothetical protein